MGHPARVVFAIISFLLISFAASDRAAAQVVPSVVEELRLVTQDAQAATFILRFSPREPRIAAIDRDPAQPELIMATTVKAGRVPAQASYRGFVRRLQFVTQGSSLILRCDTAGPATIEFEEIGNKSVQVTVARVSDEEIIGSRPIGSAQDEVIP